MALFSLLFLVGICFHEHFPLDTLIPSIQARILMFRLSRFLYTLFVVTLTFISKINVLDKAIILLNYCLFVSNFL